MSSRPNSTKAFLQSEVPKLIYQAIVESMTDPFCIIDRRYRVLWVNEEKSPNKIIGRPCYRLYKKQDHPCRDCPVTTVFQTGRPCIMEKWVPFKDGAEIWGEIRAYPVKDQASNVRYAIKIGHDLSEKWQSQEKQKKYVESLESALFNMARNPTSAPVMSGDNALPAGLSPRELEILRLMADGLTNKEISRVFSISPHTVKSHVIHIFNKLGVNDRAQASVWATRLQLI